jgi:acyl-coenzyme A thioesterase PaaI-like protein
MEMKISFFRPHIKGPLRAEGIVAKRGRRVAFAEAVLTNQNKEIVAKANGTWLFLTG